MAIQAGQVEAQLVLHASQFNKGMTQAGQSLNQFAQNITGLSRKTSGFQKSLTVLGVAAGAAGFAITKFGRQAFAAAADVQEMDVAIGAVGKSTGLGADNIRRAVKDIRSMGIELKASQEMAMLFVKGNIELSKASKVARVAQDLAVLSQSNSTETATTLTYAIQTGNSMLLKNAGITKYASEAYASYARQLKKSTNDLTATERQQAIVNMILEEGKKVAGVYEASMQEAGKVLRSFPRLLNDISIEFGRVITKGFGPVVLSAYKATEAFSKMLRSGGSLNPVLKAMQKAFYDIVTPLKTLFDAITSKMRMFTGFSSTIDQMAASAAKLTPVIAGVGSALALLAGRNILQALPVVGKFARLIGMGGPLGTGLVFLIGMSPKLRGVFTNMVAALKPMVPAFIEIAKVAASTMTQLAELVGNIAMALEGPLVGAVSAAAYTFLGLSKAILEVIQPVLSLLEAFTANQTAVQVFAAVLTAVLVKSLVLSRVASFNLMAAIIKLGATSQTVVGKMATQFATLKAFGVGTFSALKFTAVTSFKAIALQARALAVSLATSLAPLLLITAAVYAASKAWQSYSKRKEEVRERTKAVTEVINEQIAALNKDTTAIAEYVTNAKTINDVLIANEESGEALERAMGILGKGTSETADTLLDLKNSARESMTALLKAEGISADYAETLARIIDAGSQLKSGTAARADDGQLMYFTEAQLIAARAVKTLNEEAKKTDLTAMYQSLTEAAVANSKFGMKALQATDAIIAQRKANGEFADDTEEAKARLEALATEMVRLQDLADQFAERTKDSGAKNFADAIEELQVQLKDGDITAEMFNSEMQNVVGFMTDASAESIKFAQEIRQQNKAFGATLQALEKSGKSQEKFTDSGYALYNQMSENAAMILNMGGSATDVVNMMKQLDTQFVASAKKAGFSEEQIDKLRKSLGYLDQIGYIEIDIQLNLDKAIAALSAFKKYTTADAYERSGTKQYFGTLLEDLEKAKAAMKESGKVGKNAFNAIRDTTKDASGETATFADAQKMLVEKIKDQKKRVIEAKNALRDYAREAASSMYKAVGLSSVYDKAMEKAQRRFDITTEYNQIIGAQKSMVDLVRLQNQFAVGVGEAVASALSFSGAVSEQQQLAADAASAAEKQAEAEEKLAEATEERQSFLDEIASLEEQIAAATGRYTKRVLRDELEKVQEDLAKATEKYAEAEAEAALAAEETNKAQAKKITFLQGLEKQAKQALDFSKVVADLTKAGLSEDAMRQVVAAGAEAGTTLGKELLEGGTDTITKANKFVKTIVDEGQSITKKYAQTLTDTLQAEIDADAAQYAALGKEVGSLISTELNAQALKARGFAEKVRQLISMGLRGTQLEEVVNAGVDAGTDIANALIQSGASTIEHSVRLQDALKIEAMDLGDALVPYFDQTGVLLAQALLDKMEYTLRNLKTILEGKTGKEIKEWMDNFDFQMEQWARSVTDKMTRAAGGTPPPPQPTYTPPGGTSTPGGTLTADQKRAVEALASPNIPFSSAALRVSGVAEMNRAAAGAISYDTAVELIRRRTGLAAGGIVTRPMISEIGEAGPEAVIPLNRLGNFGSATNYNITVNAGVGSDGTQIGAKIVEYIKRYEKSNGTRWRS